MSRPFHVSSVNAQGVTKPPAVVLANVRATLPGVAIAGLQEVAPLREAKHTLRANLSGRIVGVHQNCATLATAGSAVVWDKRVGDVRGRGVVLLASPEPGDNMRRRYGAWVDLDIDGEILRYIAAHRPLKSTGDQPEFDRNLALFIERTPHPWIVAMDANTPDLPPVLDRLGKWRHVGIDGFLVEQSITTRRAFKLPDTPSDHRPIAMEVRL